MPGIRVDRFVALTAAVLLSGTGGALAGMGPDTASSDAALAAPGAPAAATESKASDTAKTAAPADASPVTADSKDSTPAAAAPAEAKPVLATPAPAAAQDNPVSAAPPAAQASPAAVTPSAAQATPAPATPAPAAPSTDTAATPAAPPASPDTAIADQLHDLSSGKFDRVLSNKKDRTQIDAFYAARNYQPLWITNGKANDRATAAIGYLAHVDADGLFPSDYPTPNFAAATSPADLAKDEIQLTASVLTYVHHASIGRVAWSRVSADIGYDRQAPEPSETLPALANAQDEAAQLASYEPQTHGYVGLKEKLAEIRAGRLARDTKPQIANGPTLKVGMQDERVPELRQRLSVSGEGTTFDKSLAAAVKLFQQDHKIPTSATLTPATVEALNGVRPDRAEDIVIANMERWRWMPHQLPDNYVLVNLPDFTLHVMHDGKQIWVTRIVDGKPDTPTPIMTADMKYITVNPTWNVPPSIINHEYLPALQQDPTVLDRMGLKVARNPDGSVHIWQPPGDKNALGRIRFNFPNKFLVYQHDTPDKYLFAYDKRAYSHGCMRVQDPAHYAEVLLSIERPSEGYTEDRIRRMFGPNETDIPFPTPLQVDLTYQTAFVDDAGKLEFRDDVYGRDRALLAILHDDRRDADIPVEHHEDASHREAMALPDDSPVFGNRSLFGGGGNYYPGGGGNFFSRLFGGFSNTPPAPVRHPAPHRKVTKRDTVER